MSVCCLRASKLFQSCVPRLPYRPFHLTKTMGNQESLLGRDFPVAQSNCRIVVVGAKSGDRSLLALGSLPKEARIIATGHTLEEIQKDGELYMEVLLSALFGSRCCSLMCFISHGIVGKRSPEHDGYL